MTSPIRIAILENHQTTIDGYRFRLPAPEFEIVGVAEVYSDWEPLLAAQAADIALMDVKVPLRPDNSDPYPILRAIPKLVQTYPNLALLVISAYPEPTLMLGVLEAGASGFILKDDNALLRELPSVVRSTVFNRGIYLSPAVRQIWLQRQARRAEHELSARQLEALALSATYPQESTTQLGARMNVAPSTARNLLSQAYLRLGVSTRMAAILKAKELGLIRIPEQASLA